MYIKKLMKGLLTNSLMVFFLASAATSEERIFYSKGWNLPDPAKLIMDSVEKIKLPGIPIEITAETRLARSEVDYYIQNPKAWLDDGIDSQALIYQLVKGLITYSSPDGHVLCYVYFYARGGPPGSKANAATIALVCDLDGDGRNETDMGFVGDIDRDKLLTSIIKVKLGLSEEAGLIKRLVHAACAQLNENALSNVNHIPSPVEKR